MKNLVIVLLAYALIFICDFVKDEYYYFACSIAYPIIAIAATYNPTADPLKFLGNKNSMKMLTIYAGVNVITAIACLLLNYDFRVMEYIVWNSPLNLCSVIFALEIILIISGLSSVLISVSDFILTYSRKYTASNYRVVTIK